MGQQSLSSLKNTNRTFDNILDSYLNLQDGGTVSAATTISTTSAAGGAFVVTGATSGENNLLTGAGTANNASNAYGSTVLGITPNAHGSGLPDAAINTYVEKVGGIIYTNILIDLHGGAADGGAANDVIGTDGGAANAYIAELTAAVNGIPFEVEFWCVEVPTGGDPDINLVCSATATDANDAAVTSGTVLMDNGDLTLGYYNSIDAGATLAALTKKYLYLTCGDTTDALYTAGKIGIRISGMGVDFAG